GSRGARQAGRLHAVRGFDRQHDQSHPLRKAQLRFQAGFRAGGAAGHHSEHPGGASQAADQVGAGIHRLRQAASRQADLRVVRQRLVHPPVVRDLQDGNRHRHPACAVSRQRPGGGRSAGRAGGFHVRQPALVAAPREGRQAARPGRDLAGAGALCPRRADAGGVRPAGLFGAVLVRGDGARQDAAARRRQAERGHQPGPGQRRHARSLCRRRLRAAGRAQHAGDLAEIHRQRNRQVGQGRDHGRPQSAIAGPQEPYVYPIDFFLRAAARYPGRIALDTPQGAWTYARLRDEVQALSAALQALDPAPQSRVAICAGNTAQHAVALLAVLAAGKVWVPLNYRSTAPEIARIVAATEPGIVITDQVGAPLVQGAASVHVRLDASQGDLSLASLLQAYAGGAPVRCEPGTDATQAIKFTGGTTGLPKGVMQPYRAWNAVIVNQIHAWQLTSEDRYVVAAPVTHGTSTYLLPVLAQGGTHLFLAESSPAAITAAFRERGGTLAFMPPTLIYMLMAQPGVSRADFPRLRNLIYGGAPMPVEKFEQVRDFFGPVVGATYGQTESPQIVT